MYTSASKSKSKDITEMSAPATTTVIGEKKTIRVRKPKKVVTVEQINQEEELLSHIPEISVKELVEQELTAGIQKQINDNVGIYSDIIAESVLGHLGQYTEAPFQIIQSYFEGQHLDRLVRHQIESYNHFINNQVQRTIDMFNPVTVHSENDYVEEHKAYMLEVFIYFENFKLYPPQIHENNGATKLMLPQEAKLRNFTYASTMTVDIRLEYMIRNTDAMDQPRTIKKFLPKINIGKMPIMLKSSICVLTQNKHIHPAYTNECTMDSGGYFIIKGSEKTVLGQERAAENRIYCFDGKNTTKWDFFAEIKSIPDFKCISPKQIEMMIASKNNGFGKGIYIQIPRMKQPIELFTLFRALGILTDREICEFIVLDTTDTQKSDILKFLQASIIDSSKYMTHEDAMRHVTANVTFMPLNMDRETGAKKKREFAQDVLDNDLFPHCRSKEQKLFLVGYMANKLIQTALGLLPPDDRDSYINKRIDLTGTLLNNLFRNYFNKLVKEMQKQIVREINNGSWRSTEDYENIVNMTNIYKIMKSTTIENGINRALATGDFSIKQSNSSKVGVAQVLNRLTYVSSLSHLRRINTPLEKSGELIAPRKLHSTTFGFLCLTGDSEILLSDKTTTKKIKDMVDGDRVTTVNPITLLDEPSDIHSFFCKMPDKLFEITTISGRKIKATGNHPFLVDNGSENIWKEVDELNLGDKMYVRKIDNDGTGYYMTDILNSVIEIQKEPVYDFTTRSNNHSFVASSFVTHNCPAETPEGQSIGIVKNISYLAHITIPSNNESLYEYVKPFIVPIEKITPAEANHKVKVFINGSWVGITDMPLDLYMDMKTKKYSCIINVYSSIIFDIKLKEIRICTDGGRLTRPILKVCNGKAVITKSVIEKLESNEISWNDLFTNCRLDDSVIEYIDPEEQNFAMIAMQAKDSMMHDPAVKYNFTHCEIHPSTIFGVLASCIPFPEHNQAPRNTYQCLHPEELVWMANGTKKMIKDVQIDEEVLSFHPDTFDISKTRVVNHFVRKNEFPIYKVTTISGRTIKATGDHKFMTNSGWKTVTDMLNDPSLCIGVSTKDYSISNTTSQYINVLLNEEQFIQKMRDLGIEETPNRRVNKIFKYAEQLRNAGLLPLVENNPKLAILARIIGFLYADGSINIYSKSKYNTKDFQCSFDFGRQIDAIDMEDDIVTCGFTPVKILEGTRSFKSCDSNRIQTHHTFACIHNGCLPAFLIAIGISYGKKTENTRNEIPTWIRRSNEYGRQFMKGFQGGDGCKIKYVNTIDKRTNKPATIIQIGNTSQQIHPMYKDSLCLFMNQCKEILNNLNISTGPELLVQTISDSRIQVSYSISSATSNLITYYDKVGYAYCETKNNISFNVIEYLKSKRAYNKSKFMSITDWSESLNIINSMAFVPVNSVILEPDGFVSDIEVESENHSFITSYGIASSNCAMGKQAMGVYATNYDKRMDKTAYVLNYPTRPLVDTRLMNFIHLNNIPSGAMVNVAIMTHTGYNQEDSVLISKGALDRGLFMATIYHTEKDEDKNIIRDEIVRCKPDKARTKGIKFGNYDKLTSQGFIPENELVENRDVIIAKIIPIKENRNDPTKTIKFEDQSKTFRTTEETYIDKNFTGRNGDGYNFAKVRVRILRKPVMGDKISSRHGQKGTLGNIIPEEDMPFTKDGLRPDIIINPHAIPSRMTIAQLKETLLGKVLLELGMFGDGTSFGNLSVTTIAKELQNLGYESYGNELLYNGLTGEQLETNIFMGPVFYQRLKHMVNDKQHSRAIGPMVNLTRQPAEGRSRDGGFRIGEMERDVMIAHGMSRFCKERLYDVSDKYSVHVCKRCGLIASYNDGDKRKGCAVDFAVHLCKTCGNTTDFAKVNIPYAYKLMAQELQTINVVPRIMTE